MSVRIPVIAIVGCPNVGKSTFFNRLLGARRAIVEDTPGVTRDRNYALVERYEFPFYLIDTGGLESAPVEEMSKLVQRQTLLAIEEADVILALFDGTLGVQDADYLVADLLRRYKKPVLYVVNKCDGDEQSVRAAEFYSLGLSEIFDCSALHGRAVRGIVDRIMHLIPDYEEILEGRHREHAERAAEEQKARELYVDRPAIAGDDELAEEFETDEEEADAVDEGEIEFAPVFVPGEGEEGDGAEVYERAFRLVPLTEGSAAREAYPEDEFAAEEEKAPELPESIASIKVAIVGKPNVGKSTLLNSLAGSSRAITSPIAGTTRDSLDVSVVREGQNYTLVDTAGLRKQARIVDQIEHYSVVRALSSLSECDVAVLVIDATQGPSEQDVKIAGLAHDQGRALIIALNKWDAVEKDHTTVKAVKHEIALQFKFAPYAPIVFLSAISGRRCENLLREVRKVAFERLRRIPTNRLNRVLRANLKRLSPPSYRGQPVKLFFATQVDVGPPRFALFFNYSQGIHFSYLRFIKNIIRDTFGFMGTDIKLVIKKR